MSHPEPTIAPSVDPDSTDTDAYLGGFADLTDEVRVDALAVNGAIPTWLSGALVRVTPAQKQFADRSVGHWFDGLAMLHRFGIDEGQVSYANRFLDTGTRRAALASGGRSMSGFATDPCRSLFQRVQSVFRPGTTDNANVNVARLGEEFVAMTEVPLAVTFDSQTLRTLGTDSVAAPLGQISTAHPHHDPARQEFLNFTVQLGRHSRYRLFARHGAEPSGLREIASLDGVDRPAYMHSFAITENYLLLVENPLVVNPIRLALGTAPFIDNYRWRPERGLRMHAFDRRTGERARSWRADAAFVFHTINAYERDDTICLDVCAYADASIIDLLRLGDESDGPRLPASGNAYPVRYELPMAGEAAVSVQTLAETDLELPRINYAAHNGTRYRFAYGNSAAGHPFLKDLVKVDVETGKVWRWSEPGAWAGEPVFIAAPQASAEDDGVLLSVVYDATTARSFLLVLDAADLCELARAGAPHHVPFGFHGQFFRGA